MAHWAELNDQKIVIRVLVTSNDEPDEGLAWLETNLGGQWKKTSYNTRGNVHQLGGTPYRKNYAGIGYTYDEARDAFIPPQPFASWTLDENTCLWNPPVPYPTDGDVYEWNEESGRWDQV